MITRFDSEDLSEIVGSKRKRHDAVADRFKATTRSDIGFVTSAGRIIRIHASDIPAVSDPTDLAGGAKAADFLGLAKKERLLHAFVLDDNAKLAIGTKRGVVKRLSNDWPAKHEFEIIALKPGDEVIGACQGDYSKEYVFITSDAQLLRFNADSVRPTGRGAAGISGMSMGKDANAIYFGCTAPEAIVVTAANNSDALPGTDPGSAKASLLSEFPSKGRSTSGVRAHKFIRNENQLYFAWVGSADALAATVDGKPIDLDLEPAKRDASGTKITSALGGLGSR
jgi:DNA gyrase subunit A